MRRLVRNIREAFPNNENLMVQVGLLDRDGAARSASVVRYGPRKTLTTVVGKTELAQS